MNKEVNISFVDGSNLSMKCSDSEFEGFLEEVATSKLASIDFQGGAIHLITSNIVRINETKSEVDSIGR